MDELFRHPPDVQRELRDLMRQVPRGKATTCGALAEALGNVVASRWIGAFLREHNHTARCPCHRVVLISGELGGYFSGDVAEKARRLQQEGVTLVDGRVDLAACGHFQFESSRPLETLAVQQRSLLGRLRLEYDGPPPSLAAGVDVSYAGDEGVAAYALIELDTGKLLWSTTLRRRVTFPYISSYLAYRELPLLLELLDAARREDRLADVVLVDGSGILHPRGAGIASQLGIVGGVPTIGVTKKLLCGKVKLAGMRPREMRPVEGNDGRPIGFAVRHRPKSPRPLFISPGHGVSVAMSGDLVDKLLLGRNLPEPIYWADRLSRAECQVIRQR
jgi:deoxyribonuclease V